MHPLIQQCQLMHSNPLHHGWLGSLEATLSRQLELLEQPLTPSPVANDDLLVGRSYLIGITPYGWLDNLACNKQIRRNQAIAHRTGRVYEGPQPTLVGSHRGENAVPSDPAARNFLNALREERVKSGDDTGPEPNYVPGPHAEPGDTAMGDTVGTRQDRRRPRRALIDLSRARRLMSKSVRCCEPCH